MISHIVSKTLAKSALILKGTTPYRIPKEIGSNWNRAIYVAMIDFLTCIKFSQIFNSADIN